MENEVINETEETKSQDVQSSVADETKTSDAAAAEQEQNATEEDFGSILERFEQEQTAFHSGELVQGKIVSVSDRGVLIDFGYKSEGVAPVEEFTDAEGNSTAKPGDEVEVIIRSMDSGDSAPHLSYMDAKRRRAWDEIEQANNEGKPITGRVVGKTKGGLRIDINGVEAFMPGSQADSRPLRNLDQFLGQDMEAQIIKFSRKRNNIVLSRKVLTDEVINKQKSETFANLQPGYVIEGAVRSLTDYGAFVDIGGVDGLLHVTDMSWGRLDRPSDMFKVSEHVQVKVLKFDREKEKISLGYKQLLPDPWATVAEIYPIGSTLKGKVSSVAEYGAFVELEPGVEGLVHVSEMSWAKRNVSPKNLVKSGDEVEVKILGINQKDRRISLGMKQLQQNPWDTIRQRFQVGQKVHGQVRNLTEFGAFVELEDGIDGLVHISDISWSKKINHPKDVLKRGQEVDAVITNIDVPGQRMSLSIKELTPSEWETFVATHRPGDVVRGKISRFAGFGVFVELGEGLEGLCHISELSDERVERAEDVVKLGDEMDFKILRIENDVQKIGLSHRAVGKEDEPEIDTKVYSTEAKGGMASLGELANLKFGRSEEAKPEAETAKTDDSKTTENKDDETNAVSSSDSDENSASENTDKNVSTETPAAVETETNDSGAANDQNAEAVSTDETSPNSGENSDNRDQTTDGATTAEATETPAAEVTDGETTAETAAEPTTQNADEAVDENVENSTSENSGEAEQSAKG